MPIIRTKLEHEDNFTQIPNAWLRDSRLSLKAIGLLAQLLSHSQGWSVSLDSLARANNCGRDLIRSAVAELEQAGYLIRKQERRAGLFAEAIYYTTAPLSGFPMSDKPMSDNPTPKNKSIKNKSNKKFDDWFDEFWQAYPRKVGKATAYKAFIGLGEESAHAVAGARRLAHDPNLPPVQFIPHPTTWLKRQGWLDDPYPPREKSKDELDAERRVITEANRAKERERAAELLAEMQEREKESTPPPLCEHGNKIVFCRICIAKGVKSD